MMFNVEREMRGIIFQKGNKICRVHSYQSSETKETSKLKIHDHMGIEKEVPFLLKPHQFDKWLLPVMVN